MTLNAWKYGLNKYGLGKFFLVSGDVVGQRGMSQTINRLKQMDKSIPEINQYLLRPLSAKLLPETLPEDVDYYRYITAANELYEKIK